MCIEFWGRGLNTVPTMLPVYFLKRGVLFADPRPIEVEKIDHDQLYLKMYSLNKIY